MNQGFKLRFDQMRENNPASEPVSPAPDAPLTYPTTGHVRNLCLVWSDGRKVFLNYAYLIEAEFDPQGERNSIRLNFSSHTVTLLGYSLDGLFMELLDHRPRFIELADERYLAGIEGIAVTDMTVESRD